jgi:hypothetical protein
MSTLDQAFRVAPEIHITVSGLQGAIGHLTEDEEEAVALAIANGANAEMYSDQAEASAAAAETALAAVLAALEGEDIDGTITFQATSRALLAAIVTPANLTSAYLSEAGREGLFVFSTANLTALVTSDPDQGVAVPPAAAPTGAAGAWVRKFDGALKPEWFGAVRNGVADDWRAITNALVFGSTRLDVGTYGTNRTILVPSGRSLCGHGMDSSIIKALATFNRLLVTNGVVASATNAKDVVLADFQVNVNKVGLGGGEAARIQGTMMNGTTDFTVRRVRVRNATGYAFFAIDALRGEYKRCQSENAQIHFECMKSQQFLYDGCTAAAGDGDIACQAFFHPLTRCQKIIYRDCRGSGPAGAGIEISANEVTGGQDDIRLIGCDLTSTTGIAIVSNGNQGNTNILLENSRFTSLTLADSLAANLEYASGVIRNSKFRGANVSVRLNGGEWTLDGVDTAAAPFVGATGFGLLVEGATGIARVTGGHLSGGNAAGRGYSVGVGALITIGPTTRISPFGSGFYARKFLNAGDSTTADKVVGNGYEDTTQRWSIPAEAGRRYRLRARGAWSHANGASNGRLALLAEGGAAGVVRGWLFLGNPANARVLNYVNAMLGVGNAGSRVEAQGDPTAFHECGLDVSFECAVSGILAVQFGTSNAAHAMSIDVGAGMHVEEY